MRTLCFGAVLWDCLETSRTIGGAPFNVAANLARLGAESLMMTRIGLDALGAEAEAVIKQLGVLPALLQKDPVHTTGWAKVSLDASGSASYSFPDEPTYEHIELPDDTLKILRENPPDAICFGTLEQKGETARNTLMRLLEEIPFREVFYDVNIRRDFCPEAILRSSLRHTTLFKVNGDELAPVSKSLFSTVLPETELIQKLFAEFPLKAVSVTRGPKGATAYSRKDRFDVPPEPVQVVDTVGAGDAFSAAFLWSWLQCGDVQKSLVAGNRRGGAVAGIQGALSDMNGIREDA